MLSRRTLLVTVGCFTWMGCAKAIELPPATSFLKALRLMDRNGETLPKTWVVSQANPIDPTIQFETVDPPKVLAGRTVAPKENWGVVAEIRDDQDTVRWASEFRSATTFGEETIADQSGQLVWESPAAPRSLPNGNTWLWSHCRVDHPGQFTLVVRLYPTAFRPPTSPNISYGEGIEVARHALLVEPGQRPAGSLTMSFINGQSLNRSIHRQMKAKRKS